MRHRLALLVSVAWLGAALSARSADEPADKPAEARRSTVTFDQSSLHSSFADIQKRFRWGSPPPEQRVEYPLARESFEVYVPDGGQPDQPYGLIVWIAPGPGGEPPKEWLPVLDKHRLIWIGANRSGNDRSPFFHRFALALDALHNAGQRWTIDRSRTYVAGLSGGGRCASHLAVCYPDLFQGGLFICGVNYFRVVEIPGQDGLAYKPSFLPPAQDLLNLARKRSRFVLLTGETDGNRQQTRTFFDGGFVRDGFEQTTYLEVPGMGHANPDAEWFEKAVEALEPEQEPE